MKFSKLQFLGVLFIFLFASQVRAENLDHGCQQSGWTVQTIDINGIERKVLWKGPKGEWTSGAILVLHGGGGEAAHFCAGGLLVKPQIRFAQMAINNKFGVFLLDATTDMVTDAQGRNCGKRFDFSVLDRENVDLPYIEQIIKKVIPAVRPRRSAEKIFMTGLSTGGYMTIRAATHFNELVTAFAPISAGDPYGTDTVCDTDLSQRTSAKGILTDRETGQEIVRIRSCYSPSYPNESAWPLMKKKINFKQFHHEKDGIVDLSCFEKATIQLVGQGYSDDGAFLISGRGKRNALNHLWQSEYNRPLIEFFKSFSNSGGARRFSTR